MHYVLDGKIASAHPYQLDKTLSVEGAGAEAKATGDAFKQANQNLEAHVKDRNNPHGVTKKQLGLENVDNTADSEKPVSTLQAEAIREVKTLAEEAKREASSADASAQNALQKSGGTMEGEINMNGNRISGLPDPMEDGDAATKSWVETYFIETLMGGAW